MEMISLGLAAMLALSLVLITPLRLPFLEFWFRGLPRLYRWHHRLSWLLLALMIGHALTTLLPFLSLASSWSERFAILVDPQDPVTFSGFLALLFFATTMALSYVRRWHHSLWLWVHRLSLLGLAAVLVHLAALSQYWWDPLMGCAFGWETLSKMIPVLLAAFATILCMIHYLFPALIEHKTKFTVQEVRRLRSDVVQLTLRLQASRPHRWSGGSFGFFRFDCRGPCQVSHERHPFTVINATENSLTLVIKGLGDDTERLQHIVPGTRGEVTGPHGTFVRLTQTHRPQLWIAGGIGLAPFMGLLQHPTFSQDQAPDVVLVAQSRKSSSPLFRKELEELASRSSWFHFIPLDDEPGQELSWDDLVRKVPDWAERRVALAGPDGMIQAWTRALTRHGLAKSAILREDFLSRN